MSEQEKSKGEVYEGIAFSFCKAATVALIFAKFALPAAALLCATFYVLAYISHKRDTRCVLGPPLVVAGFWVMVALCWGVWTYAREPLLSIMHR
jgi:hypothetical protein